MTNGQRQGADFRSVRGSALANEHAEYADRVGPLAVEYPEHSSAEMRTAG